MSLPAQPILVNPKEQQLTETDESKKPSIPPIIIFVVIYGIILYSIAGYFFLKTKFTTTKKVDNSLIAELPTPTITPIQLNESSNSATNRASFTELNAPLRVPFSLITVLSDGNPMRATTSADVIDIPISISTILLQKIVAYRYGSLTVLGPKDWFSDGSRGEYGINMRLYQVHPYVYPSPALWVFKGDTGSIPALVESGKLFSTIREQWSEFKTNTPAPKPYEEIVITPITPHLLRFTGPLNDGLETIAVAFSDAENHKNDKQWNFIKMTIMVPQFQHQFAMDILNLFIQQYELDIK